VGCAFVLALRGLAGESQLEGRALEVLMPIET
jgi:hypothetical protein